MWVAREHHRFEAAGKPFVYLVPSAAIFELDEAADALLRALNTRPHAHEELARRQAEGEPGFEHVDDTLAELVRVQAIGEVAARPAPPPAPPRNIIPLVPLTTMVLNVTNQCNLSCTYCYEYGEDKIVNTENGRQPKFMTEETARESVEFLLRESGAVAHITFFGGETLLNFPVLQQTIAYARRRAAEEGKAVDFSLTTNATLLKPEVIEFLAENRIGVTISIDGPKEVQDKFRVFNNGAGSYDLVAPKIKELLKRHRSRPIGARVTLTSANMDVQRIFRHLTQDIGFWEVGFAPVTTASVREHAISDAGYDRMLDQFRELAFEFCEAAASNRHHGFSNVKETLEELHKGVSKAYPCGAGLGLLGVATDGDVALCHRFAGSDAHKVGSVRDGVDRGAQQAFLDKHHIAHKTDCRVCWARPLCSGGCYHEAHTRYGDTAHANLHYCEWIRGWTDVCLQVYGELSVRNPAFFAQFEDEHEASQAR
ncbi:MAG TPA: quinohemoprotein amine dehydrogenase maturation protein [Vicinamibacterales bacterium]|nr:quinohemoprotein amine dehydrogenase maturation protein [Vicinamibacterales bacterium]